MSCALKAHCKLVIRNFVTHANRSSNDPSKSVPDAVMASGNQSQEHSSFRSWERMLPPSNSPFLSRKKGIPHLQVTEHRLYCSNSESGVENWQYGLRPLESAKKVPMGPYVAVTIPSSLSLSFAYYWQEREGVVLQLLFFYDLVSPSLHLPLLGLFPWLFSAQNL